MSSLQGSHRGKALDHTWSFVEDNPERVIVDEHFYASPDWFLKAANRHDKYRRTGAKVFAGEYAAHFPTILTPSALRRKAPNPLRSAIAGSAFYTGLVRNSDVVVMSSYAPLLNLVSHGQWQHDFFDFNPFTVQRTMNYWAQTLFSTELGAHVVATSTDVPPDVFTVATADTDRAIVHIVNASARRHSLRVNLGTNARYCQVASISGDPDAALTLKSSDQVALASPIVEWWIPVKDGVVDIESAAESVTRVVATLPVL